MRWPTRELVADDSQGVRLATIQALAQYWANGYDWRKIETRLNATPQFVTEVEGVDVQFIHVRSKHDNALPLITGYGYSAEPTVLVWDPVRIAKAWVAPMQRLGYQRFVAQG